MVYKILGHLFLKFFSNKVNVLIVYKSRLLIQVYKTRLLIFQYFFIRKTSRRAGVVYAQTSNFSVFY